MEAVLYSRRLDKGCEITQGSEGQPDNESSRNICQVGNLVNYSEVSAEADWPYGVNISRWPEGYESHDAKPVEVEVRRQ
jgi:hypothetical protein